MQFFGLSNGNPWLINLISSFSDFFSEHMLDQDLFGRESLIAFL